MVLSYASTDAPHSISPGVALNKFCVASRNEFYTQIRVLWKFRKADFIHHVIFYRFPVGTEFDYTTKMLSAFRSQSAEFTCTLWTLCRLKSGLVIFKTKTIINHWGWIKITEEKILSFKRCNRRRHFGLISFHFCTTMRTVRTFMPVAFIVQQTAAATVWANIPYFSPLRNPMCMGKRYALIMLYLGFLVRFNCGYVEFGKLL